MITDCDIEHRSVLLHDDAVKGERKRDPLVFLNAAVVMRIKISEFIVFVKRILLNIHARRVNVCA